MSDNTTLNPGASGDVIASDDISGVKFQRIKIIYGGDGVNSGDVSTANPFPISDAGGSLTVDDGAGSLTVDNAGTFAVQATLAAETTKVIGTINLSAAQTLATVTTVSAVTSITNVVHVDDNAGSLTVDNAGTFAVQATLAAETTKVIGTINLSAAQTLATVTTVGTVTTITNVVHVDDNAGSLTVDNGGTFAVQAAQSGNWSVRAQDGAGNALTSKSAGAERAISVAIVDGSGTQITTFGGGTQFAEDAAATSGDVGTVALAVRQDTISNSTSADGDYGTLKLNSVGRLYTSATIDAALPTGANAIGKLSSNTGVTIGAVEIAAAQTLATVTTVSTVSSVAAVTPGTGATNLGKAEDAAHTTGDVGVMALGVRQDANTSLVGTDLDYAPFQLDANGNLKVAIITGAGSGGTAQTDGATYTASTTSGTPIMGARDDASVSTLAEDKVGIIRATTNRALHVNLRDASGNELSVGGGTQFAEDAASTSGDVGTVAIVVRQDTIASSTSADGDYTTLKSNSIGRLYTSSTIDAAIPTGANVIGAVTQSGTWNVGTLTTITNVVHVDDNAGNLSIDDGGNSITVDNSGTFAVQATIAAGTTTIGKAEDAASADADVGVPAMAVRKATPANTSGTDGDYEFLQMSAGRLWASATIDAALPAGTNAIGKLSSNTGVTIGAVEIAAAQTLATVTTVTTVTSIGTSVTPGTSAAHLGKAEDAAHASGDTGVLSLGVRQDTLASSTSADGDYAALKTSATGALYVNVAEGGVPGLAEDAASAGGESGIMMLAVRRDTPSSGVSADGDFAALSVDSNGALRVSGAGGGTQFVEDAPATSGDTGTMVLAVRQDTIASSTSADGDYGTLKLNSVGRLYVTATVDAALPTGANVIGALSANQSVNVAQINGVTALMGNGVTGTGSQRVTVASDNTAFTVNTQAVPGSAPGTTTSRIKSAASTNATNLKASAGVFLGYDLSNNTASDKYVKLYNKASSPTVGTDTPFYTILVPKNGGRVADWSAGGGLVMGTGVSYAITGAITDADTTATAADDVHGMMLWK